jgi:hypothetical protein
MKRKFIYRPGKRFIIHPRRFRGRLRWNSDNYFKRSALTYKFYKRRFLRSHRFLTTLTKRRKAHLKPFSFRFIKLYYFLKYSNYCVKSTILNPTILSNYYFIFMTDHFHGNKNSILSNAISYHSKYINSYNSPSQIKALFQTQFYASNTYKFINRSRIFRDKFYISRLRNCENYSLTCQKYYSVMLYYKKLNDYYLSRLRYYRMIKKLCKQTRNYWSFHLNYFKNNFEGKLRRTYIYSKFFTWNNNYLLILKRYRQWKKRYMSFRRIMLIYYNPRQASILKKNRYLISNRKIHRKIK